MRHSKKTSSKGIVVALILAGVVIAMAGCAEKLTQTPENQSAADTFQQALF